MPAQRIRVWFAQSPGDRSRSDILGYWEAACRRAGLTLDTVGARKGQPLALAASLPLGFAAEREIVDITLAERLPLDELDLRLRAETTDPTVVEVEEVPVVAPPPQASLRWAGYRVDLPAVPLPAAACAVQHFLEASDAPWHDVRPGKQRTTNLRLTVGSLTAEPLPGETGVRLTMRLRAGQELNGRPERIAAALFPGVEPLDIVRTSLELEDPSAARELWRRRGQYD